MNAPDLLLFAGRIILGSYFVNAGWQHVRDRTMMAQFAATKKAPFPMLAILGTGTLLTLGGLSLLSGIYPHVGLALLAAFFVGVTPMMHDFWAIKDPMQRMIQKINFTKNLALLGALLALAAIPQPWSYSLAGLI